MKSGFKTHGPLTSVRFIAADIVTDCVTQIWGNGALVWAQYYNKYAENWGEGERMVLVKRGSFEKSDLLLKDAICDLFMYL